MPSPGNPQSLNRYSYTLNNPLRYTDPTGMFSEDEIMENYGVNTWDEVLALFEKGGRLESLWGWLEVLRLAKVGERFEIHPHHAGYPAILSGVWGKDQGQLLVTNSAGVTFSTDALALIGSSTENMWFQTNGYFVTEAHTRYDRLRFRPSSEVDWPGVGMDVAGITADILTLGAGGRLVNGVQVSRSAGRVGAALDVASITYAGVQTGAAVVQGDWSSAGGGAVDMTLAGLGTQIPIVFDVVSLIKAFVRWSP